MGHLLIRDGAQDRLTGTQKLGGGRDSFDVCLTGHCNQCTTCVAICMSFLATNF